MFGSSGIKYDTSPVNLEYTNDSHSLIVGLVKDGTRVLEIGCATGTISLSLQSKKACEVKAIERDRNAAAIARTRGIDVSVGDVEIMDLKGNFGTKAFEAIVLGDTLEHLVDPVGLLTRLTELLTDEGAIFASIHNVAHGDVRLQALAGEFRYQETGILDRTHLHFYN